MALVEGGKPTDEQLKRWRSLYPEVPTPTEVAAFCLDLNEGTEADLSARGSELMLHALACDGKGGGSTFYAGVRCASDPS